MMLRFYPYMTPTPAARASFTVTTILSFVMGLFCVLLSFVPIGHIFGTSIMPAFMLMAVYYWAVVRPDVFLAYIVFLNGLIYDLLSAGPIGLWAFVYILTYAVVLTQRFIIINTSFFIFWLGFLFTAFFAGVVSWCIASLIYSTIFTVRPILMQTLVTVAVFPILSFLLKRIEHQILSSC